MVFQMEFGEGDTVNEYGVYLKATDDDSFVIADEIASRRERKKLREHIFQINRAFLQGSRS